ncbi:MAG: S1 RNA-binding domain-containing protein [Candidatus Micrarchaeota archaeon]|nr:S1 RNA-binding domain-containing protein [Candidatus Micrarchaeota archaeon]MDE1804340.1 S1 RNA-binding domain-containing protein [Candidatus Micrarchaeota archaeon]MDE1846555.1 S1 RNA-binding domain-containing protein [Candidatus Micrarchaeota archaeon]
MIVKKEMPEVGELVLMRIKKVMPFGAYCELVEYNHDAYLPIKEVASGWIKNIHEFLKEGQKGVVKVVYIDRDKRAIDVSLKKVTKKEEKDKINDFNLEKRAENFYSQALDASGLKEKNAEVQSELSKKFMTYSDLINLFAEGKEPTGVKLSQKFIDAMKEIVAKNIKPKVYIVSYVAEVTTYDTKKGIAMIKKAFSEVEKLGVQVNYLGAPRYRMMSEDSSYPKAEERIKQATVILEKGIANSTINLKKDKV